MAQSNLKRWLRWKWPLVGSGIGVIFAGVVAALFFLLPVSLPIIGVLISAFAIWNAGLGTLLSGTVIATAIFGIGLIGGIISKAVEWSSSKINKSNMKKIVSKTLSSTSTDQQSSSTQPSVPSQSPSSHRIFIRSLGIEIYCESDDVAIEEKSDDTEEHVDTSNINTLLTDICAIDLKEAGWQQKIANIRTRLEGHEEEIIAAIQLHGNKLIEELAHNIGIKKTEGISPILKDGFLKKIYIVCHPDKWKNPHAATVLTALQNWVEYAKEQLEEIIGLAEYSEALDVLLRHMDEYIKIAEDFLRRADENLKKTGEDLKVLTDHNAEQDSSLSQIQTDIKTLKTDMQELTESMIAQCQLEESLTGSNEVSEDTDTMDSDSEEVPSESEEIEENKARRMALTITSETNKKGISLLQEALRKLMPASQYFSNSLLLPRLSLDTQGLFLRRYQARKSDQPPLLLKGKEESDKANTRPHAS